MKLFQTKRGTSPRKGGHRTNEHSTVAHAFLADRGRCADAMRFHLTPRPLLHLITTILLAPRPTAANPHPASSLQAGFSFNELFARYQCGGQLCGWNGQLCCTAGSYCYTDSNDQAQCGATSIAAGGYSSAAGGYSSQAGGHWIYITTTTVMTDLQTYTTVLSSYVAGASSYAPAASASATMHCQFALNESPCGNICCKANQYCAYLGQCSAAAASETTVKTVTQTPGAPIRPTSKGVVVVTASVSATTTVPFQSPVATGANVTMVAGASHNGGGLSGGAIAGIVIGVLVGLLILGLICFYCCLKGLLDGCLALFGLGGRKRRRTTEVEEYERRTHHSRDGGRRTWYGASKPTRIERRDKKESHAGRDLLGMGAGLAGLWAILGMKRRNNRRKNEEKYSEYSYSSDYYNTTASE